MIASAPFKFNPMILNDPVIWGLDPIEFKLYAAILSFANQDGTNAFPSNATLASMVGIKERALQNAMKSLEDAGIITRTFEIDHRGTFRVIDVNYAVVRLEVKGRVRLREGRTVMHPGGAPECTPGVQRSAGDHSNTNHNPSTSSSSCLLDVPSNNQSSSPRDDDGLFDGIGTRLPEPNLYKPKNPSRIAYRAILTTDQVNLASQYLGASGEDNKAPHLFSQDQADRKGFIEDVIKRCLDTARKKSVTNRVGLLCAIRDEAWNDGRYVDQETAKETARRERQLERERAFAALKW